MKEQKRQTKPMSTRPSAREGMSRDEMMVAEPIPATEPIPEEMLREFRRVDRVDPGRDHGLLRPDDLPHSDSPGSPGYRPRWLTQTYIPPDGTRTGIVRRAASPSWPEPSDDSPVAPHDRAVRSELPLERHWASVCRDEPERQRVELDGSLDEVRHGRHGWPQLASDRQPHRALGARARTVVDALRAVVLGCDCRGGFTEPFGGSFVEQFNGVQIDDDVTGRDVVICKTYRPLGDLTGWLGRWRWFSDDEYRNWPYTSVGYPGNPYQGQRPVIQAFCAIDDVDSDGDGLELETHPFTSDGWSGGPLFFWRNGAPLVVGVCAGREEEVDLWEFFTKTHSVFSGGPRLLDLIAFGEANWS